MFHSIEINGRLKQEQIERDLAFNAFRQVGRHPSPSIRRAVGHRIIAIGARLAAEPSLESARSR
jgi:hypothetical protein